MSQVQNQHEDVKEIAMDVAQSGGTRRRRGHGRKTRSARGTEDGSSAMIVEKAQSGGSVAPVPVSASAPVSAVVIATKEKQKEKEKAKVPAPIVVLSPAKKKPAKVMLVPKGAHHTSTNTYPSKTFKAKRVRVVIDNTAKTQKHRRQVLGKVDALTDDQVRTAAISAKLTRRESVAKVPVKLLRGMLRDYQTMRGQLL